MRDEREGRRRAETNMGGRKRKRGKRERKDTGTDGRIVNGREPSEKERDKRKGRR